MSKRYKNILEMSEDLYTPEFSLYVAKFMLEVEKDENRRLRGLLKKAHEALNEALKHYK